MTTELPAGDELSVGNVNFAEVDAFCRKLTELSHQSGALPNNFGQFRGSAFLTDIDQRRELGRRPGQVVAMADKAVDAVRRKKDSSVSRAVDLVKEGAADAVVSAGHTGAAVAAATIKLRTPARRRFRR